MDAFRVFVYLSLRAGPRRYDFLMEAGDDEDVSSYGGHGVGRGS